MEQLNLALFLFCEVRAWLRLGRPENFGSIGALLNALLEHLDHRRRLLVRLLLCLVCILEISEDSLVSSDARQAPSLCRCPLRTGPSSRAASPRQVPHLPLDGDLVQKGAGVRDAPLKAQRHAPQLQVEHDLRGPEQGTWWSNYYNFAKHALHATHNHHIGAQAHMDETRATASAQQSGRHIQM